jgi:leader peptidase (prepilin peptidase)/N-methyltransferase
MEMAIAFGVYLLCLVTAIALIDIRSLRIPNALSLAVLGGGCLYALSTEGGGIERALAGIAIGGLTLGFIAFSYLKLRGHAGLGGGDIKLLAALGAWTGPFGVAPILLVASLSALGFVHFRGSPLNTKARIPFGPFLGLSGFAVWLAIERGT